MNGTTNGSTNITSNGGLYVYSGSRINSSNASIRYDALIQSNYTIIQNSFIDDAGYTGGTWGALFSSVYNLNFRNNTVNRSYGLNFSGGQGAVVYNNSFWNSNNTILFESSSSNNNLNVSKLNKINYSINAITLSGVNNSFVDNNTVQNAYAGIVSKDSVRKNYNITARQNYFFNNTFGAALSYLHSSVFSHNQYANSTASAGSIALELAQDDANNLFHNETILESMFGLRLGSAGGALRNNFTRLNISRVSGLSALAEIESLQDSNNTFLNLTIVNSSTNNITSSGTSFIELINSTINESSVSALSSSNVTLKYYLSVFTGTSATAGLASVTLNYSDSRSRVFLNSTSDSSGWLNLTAVPQKVWNSSGAFLYGPTNVTGTKSGYSTNSTTANASTSATTQSILLLSATTATPTPTPTPTPTSTGGGGFFGGGSSPTTVSKTSRRRAS